MCREVNKYSRHTIGQQRCLSIAPPNRPKPWSQVTELQQILISINFALPISFGPVDLIATCTGWTAAIDDTPALAHYARNSSAVQ
jgi:hypothetical protein